MKAVGLAGFLFLLFASYPQGAGADHYYYHTLHEVHYQNRYPYHRADQTVVYTCRPVSVSSFIPACRHCVPIRRGGHVITGTVQRCSATVVETVDPEFLR